jgi:hypothetical protein
MGSGKLENGSKDRQLSSRCRFGPLSAKFRAQIRRAGRYGHKTVRWRTAFRLLVLVYTSTGMN